MPKCPDSRLRRLTEASGNEDVEDEEDIFAATKHDTEWGGDHQEGQVLTPIGWMDLDLGFVG